MDINQKISPRPSFPQPRLIRRGEKEGYITSLWKREVRRDLIIDVFILMTLLVNKHAPAFLHPHDCIRINRSCPPGGHNRCDGIRNNSKEKERCYLIYVQRRNELKFRVKDRPALEDRFKK